MNLASGKPTREDERAYMPVYDLNARESPKSSLQTSAFELLV